MSRKTHADHLLARAVIEVSGGVEAWHIADQHFGEARRSIRELADLHEMSVGAIHARCKRCWDVCERYGIVPDDWHRRTRGRVAGRITYTDKPLESQHRLDRRRNGKKL